MRRDTLAVLGLLALTLATWAPRAAGPLDFRWDGAVYYVLGTSLAEGKGYRLLNEPGEIEANQYPPLLPLLVAAHQWLVGSSDFVRVGRWLRLTFFLMFTAYVLTAYAVLRRYLPVSYAMLASTICLLNVFTNFLSDLCFAELPFALATMLFVLMNGWENQRVWSLGAGGCAVIAYLFRSIGIALFAAWVLDALLRRRFKAAAFRTAIAVMPILAWQAYIAQVERSPSYAHPAYAYQRADYMFHNVSYTRNLWLRDPFAPESGPASATDLIGRVLHNVVHVPTSLGEAVTVETPFWGLIKTVPLLGYIVPWRVVLRLPAMVGILVLTGIGILLFRGLWVIALYVMITAVAVCLTPWAVQWSRYWAPMAPFLALALALSLLAIDARSATWPERRRRITRAVLIAAVAGLLLVVAVRLVSIYRVDHRPTAVRDGAGHAVAYRLFFYGPPYRSMDAGLDWLRAHAGPQAIVAASMPQWAYLRTGLKTVMPPIQYDVTRVQTLLDSVPVSYVLVDGDEHSFTRVYSRPALLNAPERWRLVYSEPEGKLEIYQRVGRTP